MTVAVTYTLNGWFGAGVVAGRTGVVMNDEMDDFATRPGEPNMFGIVGSQANAIAPGKTPLSSMAPTIVSHDGQPAMVLGSPGGSRIPTIVLSVLTGMVDYGLDVQQAVDLPRIHEQWQPDVVQVEHGALSPLSSARSPMKATRWRSMRPGALPRAFLSVVRASAGWGRRVIMAEPTCATSPVRPWGISVIFLPAPLCMGRGMC